MCHCPEVGCCWFWCAPVRVESVFELALIFACSEMHGAPRYIERPLLLDVYKFDLRLYLCVTSMNPLEAFIYREGFTRLSTEPYRYWRVIRLSPFLQGQRFSLCV